MTTGLREDQLERIISAVETIESSLDILTRKRTVDRQTYKRDRETRDIVERRFVKMTEAAIDIGRVLLVHEQGEPGESHPTTMHLLAKVDILSDETADAMAAAARFRNVLATRTVPSSITIPCTMPSRTSNGTGRSCTRSTSSWIAPSPSTSDWRGHPASAQRRINLATL